jgi:hypothetical protein
MTRTISINRAPVPTLGRAVAELTRGWGAKGKLELESIRRLNAPGR